MSNDNKSWEYMGESVKMEDNVPTPELSVDQEYQINTWEERSEQASEILAKIRKRENEKTCAYDPCFAFEEETDKVSKEYVDNQVASYDPLELQKEELTFNYHATDLCISNEIQPASTIVINDSDVSPHALVTIHTKTGDVEFGEDYNPSHAAQIFWTAMGNNSPDKLKERIAYLEHQIEALEMDLWSHPNTDVTDAKLTIYNDEEIKQALAYEFTAEDLEELERRLAVNDTKDDGSTSPRLAYEDAMKVI